ncbi:MAG: hypothetical protein FWF67_00230, partial [Fibromonadales bacterium]|nr:hypothetical protein [Fibromonadales bacterium]
PPQQKISETYVLLQTYILAAFGSRYPFPHTNLENNTMRTQFSKLVFAATFGLALTFTLSCSGGDDTGFSFSSSGSSSPSGGGGSSSSVTESQCSSLPSGVKGTSATFVDDRDNTTYKLVEIGTQIWMAENLNYRGTEPDTLGECLRNDPAHCVTYGRLYDWVTAMGIDTKYGSEVWDGSDIKHQGVCPIGWHLPSAADWSVLTKFVNPIPSCSNENSFFMFIVCECAGTKLKSVSGWGTTDWIDYTIPGTDDYGFSALPGCNGFKVRERGCWWSATDNGAYDAMGFTMNENSEYADLYSKYKDGLRSVRCVKDLF